MAAVVWAGTDVLETREVPRPQVPDGWALVEVACTGICGTDLAILHGTHPRARHGLIPGHEIAGHVVVAAPGGPPVGALVVVEPLIWCGRCRACRAGATHVCRNLGLFGIDTPGGLAELVALPPQVLHEVPAGIDPHLAALVEPLAVAVHAVDRSGLRPGDVAAITGAGPIGVLTALVARHAGARAVVLSEPSATRRDVVRSLGLTVVPEGRSLTDVTLELTEGEGADVTFDAAGHPGVAPELTSATRVLGTIVVVAVHKEPVPLDLRAVCFKELTIRGVRVYTSADVRHAIELVADDVLGLATLPTRTYPLAEAAAAFEAASSAAYLKVFVAPDRRHP
jgi:2-desacetyl-2-hydroxyethyl bacteriochlorophyllide A dehydrogenase